MAILSNIITPTNVLTATSTNTVTNKTINIANNTLTGVQPSLVSGTSIKTINGGSVLGSGDLTVGGGSWIFLSSVTASDSATVDLTGIDDSFDYYAVVGERIVSSTNSDFLLRLFIGGSVIESSSYSFHTTNCSQGSGLYSGVGALNSSRVFLAGSQQNHASFTLYLSGARAAIKKVMHWTGVSQTSTADMRMAHGSAMLDNTGLVTGIRFFQNPGNITSGNFHLYGIKT